MRIEQLQDLGYKLSEIAIIVRENKEAQTIADRMFEYRQANPQSKYRYDVLSNDSLLINNAPVVKWLLAVMRYVVEPDNLINKAYLQQQCLLTETQFDFCEQSVFLKPEPVFDFSEKIINNYKLYERTGQEPFLQAFQDIMLQYTRREASDIRSFLNWWENEKHNKYVTMPNNQDAIRLITIHKAKGLEFDAVIIPFCNWQLCKPGKTLWCTPKEQPFSNMKLLPLKFENKLRETIFSKEYLREKMLSYIDNLNLLYVAFTRARKAMFISTPRQNKDNFTYVKNVLYRIFQQPLKTDNINNNYYIELTDYWKPQTMHFEFGNLSSVSDSKFPVSDSVSSNFKFQFSNLQIVKNLASNSAQREIGRLLHDIFKNMVTLDDLQQLLNTMIIEGSLPEAERTHIVNMVNAALENPTVRQWFAPNIDVKTEAEILLPNGTVARPDRVIFHNEQVQVIDYKFGKQVSDNHNEQLLQYMDYLSKMGYSSVAGFIWYVTLNKVVEVTLRT